MQIGAITGYIDVAQLTLYVFWGAFAALIFYLRREDKREGYPLVSDRSSRVLVQGFPAMPKQRKSFLTQHGPIYVPRVEAPTTLKATRAGWLGAPLEPLGNPMLAAIGPGAYADRADIVDYTFDFNLPKIVPLRSVPEFFLAWEDPDIRGMAVYGADDRQAGTVADAWIDRAEVVVRYVEVQLLHPKANPTVLLPMNFVRMDKKARQLRVRAIAASQFADVPGIKAPDTITFLEEDRITAYYGGGTLYAWAGRADPLL